MRRALCAGAVLVLAAGCGGTKTVTRTVTVAGETANKAAAEDGAVAPGEPVPNDHYVVDEGHRLLAYRVPPDAKVTVLVDGPESEPITIAELVQIVDGNRKPLREPIETGFWIRYRIDTVRSLDEQYGP
jgi:hypothetical protein